MGQGQITSGHRMLAGNSAPRSKAGLAAAMATAGRLASKTHRLQCQAVPPRGYCQQAGRCLLACRARRAAAVVFRCSALPFSSIMRSSRPK